MNFSLYLDDETGAELAKLGKSRRLSRNALIREAVADLVARHRTGSWPRIVAEFKGRKSLAPFEQQRRRLRVPRRDPLA